MSDSQPSSLRDSLRDSLREKSTVNLFNYAQLNMRGKEQALLATSSTASSQALLVDFTTDAPDTECLPIGPRLLEANVQDPEFGNIIE